MRVCIVSHKKCWQDEAGRWLADGGFPLQISSIASMFDQTTLVVGRGTSGPGGLPLPSGATVVTLSSPHGQDVRRKISVILRLGEYLPTLVKHVRRADVVHVPLPGRYFLSCHVRCLGDEETVARAIRRFLVSQYTDNVHEPRNSGDSENRSPGANAW